MNEILFRAKRTNGGDWVYGYLFMTNKKTVQQISLVPYIQVVDENNEYMTFEVYPESVGQFTGLLNKDELKIFSGKIKIDIAGVGGGEAEIKMYEGQWQVYEWNQGYIPLFETLKRDNITITQEH